MMWSMLLVVQDESRGLLNEDEYRMPDPGKGPEPLCPPGLCRVSSFWALRVTQGKHAP